MGAPKGNDTAGEAKLGLDSTGGWPIWRFCTAPARAIGFGDRRLVGGGMYPGGGLEDDAMYDEQRFLLGRRLPSLQ